jgi:hypothetical protein
MTTSVMSAGLLHRFVVTAWVICGVCVLVAIATAATDATEAVE